MDESEIKNYIEDNLQKGYTIDKIEESLKWSLREEEYKSILETYNKDNGNNTNSSNIEEKQAIKKPKEGMNIAVLVLGILSITLTIITFGIGIIVSLPLSIICVIFYFFSDKKKSGKAFAGIITSSINLILILIFIIFAYGASLFLQSYTQETFEQFDGNPSEEIVDETIIEVAFINKVMMYDSEDKVVVNIGRTIYTKDLSFNEFVFQGPNSTTITCSNSQGYIVNANQSNKFEFSKTNDEECSGDFVEGEFDLKMNGDTPVEINNIDYRR